MNASDAALCASAAQAWADAMLLRDVAFHECRFQLQGLLARRVTAGCAADGVFWARPWRLRAAAVRRWRVHRDGLHGLLAHPNEQTVVTSGRGHPSNRDASVLRCWRVANAAPGELRCFLTRRQHFCPRRSERSWVRCRRCCPANQAVEGSKT